MARRLSPFEPMVAALDTIPGVGRRRAEVIGAEVGTDMKQFPTPGHLASWAGVCPGNKQSGDRRQRAPTRKGNRWLKPAPVFTRAGFGGGGQVRRTDQDLLGAQYRRLARRIGAQRAAMAVAHGIAVIIHRVIQDGQHFVDLGHNYFAERDRAGLTRWAVRRLESLGHQVTLQPA